MEHVALDLGGTETQICVRASDGQIVEERRISTRKVDDWLATRAPSRVIVETCSESTAVARAARARGHEVRVVPATLVRSLGVGARGVKNDVRDARALSEASCRIDLPSVHLASDEARRWRMLCLSRQALVRSRARLVTCVRGWLRQKLVARLGGSVETFARRVRERVGGELPLPIAMLLDTIDHLTKQIARADGEAAREAKQDPVCARLMTVPGVGPITALRFRAAVDVVERFPNAHALASYLGLTPGEKSSGERSCRLGITKAGAIDVRWNLVQAAWSARRCRRNHPMVRWALEVEKRRGKHIAVTALARKIAGVLFALWRDGATYDPLRGAAAGT